jgi:hypothetical protein
VHIKKARWVPGLVGAGGAAHPCQSIDPRRRLYRSYRGANARCCRAHKGGPSQNYRDPAPQLPVVYYSLQRNADYSPTGPSGEKTHISFALRIEALPAFVMTPDGGKQVAMVRSYKAMAPKENPIADRLPFRVVDGIVIDPNAKVQAGPHAVIIPPSNSSAGQRPQ